MISLTVIIPAYNESAAIQAGKLGRVKIWLSEQAFPCELIVVDDGSLDTTAALAQSYARVIQIAHGGKAAALVAGIQNARQDVVLLMDMDQATPVAEAPKLLRAIEACADIAIGSRGLSRPGAPPGRYILSGGQVALRFLLIGLKITDTQCGFKAYRRAAIVDILDHLYLYHPGRQRVMQGASVTSGFDVECLFVARRLGYTVCETRVQWNYQETRRVSLIKDSWRGVRDLLNIRLADLAGHYPRSRAIR